MSGGSFNYLCHVYGVDELMNKRCDLRDMADSLAALGYAKDAAVETTALLSRLNQIDVQVEVAVNRLRPVWKALEWWHSCDSGEEQFRSALAKYRGTLTCSTGGRS